MIPLLAALSISKRAQEPLSDLLLPGGINDNDVRRALDHLRLPLFGFLNLEQRLHSILRSYITLYFIGERVNIFFNRLRYALLRPYRISGFRRSSDTLARRKYNRVLQFHW